MCSCSGSCNCNSTTIPRGPQGVPGTAATIAAGTASPLAAGATPTVTNVGSSSAAIFNFGIPAGEQGDIGDPGINAFSPLSSSFTQPAFNTPIDINTLSTAWMGITQIVYISSNTTIGGFYQINSKTGTTVNVTRLEWVAPNVTFILTGSTVPSNSYIIPSGTIGPEGLIKKILDETSEDAESSTSGATINNHSWTILNLLTNQDTVVFDFAIGSNSGNGNFSVVAINIGGTQVSRFTDSDATLAAEIKYNTDPTIIPAGYISSNDPLLSEDINFIKGTVKITRRNDTSIGYDITYYMYNSIIQGSYPNLSNTKMIQKIFNTVGGHGVASIDTSGLNFEFTVTPNFMSGGATFGTVVNIYNAIKLSSIL